MHHRSWPRRILPAVLAGLLAAAIGAAPAAAQVIEAEEDLLERLRELRVVLNMGAVAFEELDFARAIRDLSRILDPYQAGHLELRSAEEVEVIGRALELRGRAFFNLGQTDRADRDFESLIRLDVDYRLDRERLSPKVIDRWQEVRSRVVGTVAVEVEPIGAEILIDGEPVGLGPRLEKDLLVGRHEVRAVLEGYETAGEQVEIIAGKVTPLSVSLVRNARDVQFFSVPNGVEVFVDGRSVGTTAGTAPPEYEEMAARMSIPRGRISAPLLVRNLPPGDHRIRFARECYTGAAVRIEVELAPADQGPQDFRPVVLERSEAQIEIGTPTGADIRLDGRPAGRVPRKITGLCSGTHWVEVRMEGGARWFEEIELERDEERRIRAFPRSTLVFLGIYGRNPEGEVRADTGGALEADLRDREAFNLITGVGEPAGAGALESGSPGAGSRGAGAPEDDSPGGEYRQRLAYLQTLVADTLSRAGPAIWQAAGPLDAPLLNRAEESLGADLVLAGTAPGDGGHGPVHLFLYATGSSKPDRVILEDAGEKGARKSFLDRLTRSHRLYSPWFGADVVDTFLTESPVVIRVSDGSPAAAAGVKPGDEIRDAGGRQVRTRSELMRNVRRSEAGDRIAVRLRREQEDREVEIRLGETPELIPLSDPDLLYNKLIAEFRMRAGLARSEEERHLLMLNLGLAYLHFGDFQKAIEDGFRRAELSSGAGISRGTVQYFLGISYRELGNESRAREALGAAAAASGATLGTNDGPLVALRAERLLRTLP